MSILQIVRRDGRRPSGEGQPSVLASYSGSGPVAQTLQERIRGLSSGFPVVGTDARVASGRALPSIATKAQKSLEERLYDALAAFKVRTSSVAMHMDTDWRDKLFGQLDSLLDAEEWDAEDLPPDLHSFGTFLRMLLNMRPERRPGLAASSDGHLIATWTVGKDRLTVECLPNDEVRWLLSRCLDGETERAAGLTVIARLPEVLAPYNPAKWFTRAVSIPA